MVLSPTYENNEVSHHHGMAWQIAEGGQSLDMVGSCKYSEEEEKWGLLS